MNTKTVEQRERFYELTASSIFNFFQERKGLPFNGNCVSNFKSDYDLQCKEKGIRSYRDQISKFLSDKNSLVFKNGKCIVKDNFNKQEIFELIRDFNNRINQGNKKAVSKRNIKKVVPKLAANTSEKSSNLIPKLNFLESMETLELIDFILDKRKVIIVNNQFYIPARWQQ